MWTRKQLQETITRNKQWNEETSQKEAEIQETRRKIEQCWCNQDSYVIIVLELVHSTQSLYRFNYNAKKKLQHC